MDPFLKALSRSLRMLVPALLFSSALTAQKTDVYGQLSQKYPNENAVFVSRSEKATVKIENGEPKIYADNYEDLLLLSDKVSSYAEHPVYFSSFSEISDLQAKTLTNDNGKTKTVKVTNFPVTNEISAGTFFDDYKAQRVVFPALGKGARTILSYTEKTKEPRFYGRFYFNSYAPAEAAEYSITVPSNVKISWSLFGVKEGDLKTSTRTEGKNTIYTWRAEGIGKYDIEDDAPNFSYYAPHIVVRIDEYTINGKTTKLLDNPTDLYNWYYSMVKDVDTTVNPLIKHIADSLTTGVTDEFEKVKKLFYWVQDNVKYVAFEDGMGGFVPRGSGLVCTRRFGDCKDMANITTQMLHAAGIKTAYLTWIGTRDIPYSYTEVPAPMSDNHMICTYVKDGKYYFLDATGKNAPLEMYTSMIQGKEALVGMGPGKFEIAKVPEIDKEKNVTTDTVHLHFENPEATSSLMLRGNGAVHAKGYDKIFMGFRLQNMDETDRRDYLMRYLAKGSNKFKVDSLQYANLFDRENDLGIRYQWNLGDYAQKNGKEIYVNLSFDKTYMNQLLESSERTAPWEIEFKNVEKNVTILDIPAGYDVNYLPDNSHYDGTLFGFDIQYKKSGTTVIAEKTIWMNTLLVKPADFENWNKMVRQLTKAYNESVSLAKK